MKRLFLSLKGYGDLVVLANALQAAPYDLNVEVILSKRLLQMARKLMPSDVLLNCLNDTVDVLPLYNLRKIDRKIFHGVLELREIVKDRIHNGSSLVLDLFSLRNELIFHSIPHRYLPKSNNIYTSYSLELSHEKSEEFSLGSCNKLETVLIFPFGNSKERALSQEIQKELYHFFCKRNIIAKFVCYKSDLDQISATLIDSCIFFQSSTELIEIIKNSHLLISVDTVAIHLANYYRIPTFVISNSWDFFIPPQVLLSNRFYPSSELPKLQNDIERFLHFSQIK